MSEIVWAGNASEVRPFHVRAGGVFMGAFTTRRKAVRKAKRLLWREGWATVTVIDVRRRGRRRIAP